jgi:HD-GYP domain-containing protein (c-di-GMP phosphodiesterase class II)
MGPIPSAPGTVERRLEQLTSILEVAKVMASTRGLDVLLPLIAREACKVAEADRCTLFVLDREKSELWSKIAHGESSVIRVPVGSGLAGTVAQTGVVINIEDAYADPRFNATVDRATGYRTHTVVCVPMRDAAGAITGVLQALNKSQGAFTDEDVELLLALGGQAAGAIENALLHEEINQLFEGFVSAAVVAIESRDPTTAGHSGRVAALTVELAKAVEHSSNGPYAPTHFTHEEIQEIRYASLLHDFGKVGVRERVLVKANKLYPHELELLNARFEMARRDRQLRSVRRELEALRGGERLSPEEAERLTQELRELDEAQAFILACNRPTVLAEGGFDRLGALSHVSFEDSQGARHPLLQPEEMRRLSIPRGSLSAEERAEIESHVTHTFRFLSQIPWTRTLRRVPEIAYAHHERADGRGYPRALRKEAIPVQSKMMAISDVYDALTASDRPYKRAVPHTQALDIIAREAKEGLLDEALFQLFVEAEIARRALQGH